MNVSRPQILEYGTHLRALQSDALRERIALLLPADRAIAELVLRDGASHRQIASLMNVTPGQVSRRIRRIGERLHDARVAALLHPDCPLEPAYRQVGVERFLQDKSVKELAAEHACAAAEIRRRLDAINFWCRGLAAAAARRASVE
jgi:DNA-directed RNA polymerase specialized sigma24 family protein